METLTISPKFQVVIPKSIRVAMKLSPGQKVQAVAYLDRIELIPVRPIKQMRGFLKGIDTDVPRATDRGCVVSPIWVARSFGVQSQTEEIGHEKAILA